MKVRIGFISNSSSSSFITRLSECDKEQDCRCDDYYNSESRNIEDSFVFDDEIKDFIDYLSEKYDFNLKKEKEEFNKFRQEFLRT